MTIMEIFLILNSICLLICMKTVSALGLSLIGNGMWTSKSNITNIMMEGNVVSNKVH